MAQLRSALLEALTPEDMRAVVQGLLAKAKAGDVPAAREILERALGRPVELDLLERLDALERQLTEDKAGGVA